MKNGWLAFSLLCAACVGAVARPMVFPTATAAAPTQRCDWRYLSDGSNPEIPSADGRGVMDAEWAALSAEGYHLVTTDANLAYVFERCVPSP